MINSEKQIKNAFPQGNAFFVHFVVCGRGGTIRLRFIFTVSLASRLFIDCFLYCFVNFTANTVKIIVNIRIGKANNLKSIFVQHIGSGFVIQLSIHSIVLISVEFNNKLCTMAIKVDDKVINYALLIYFHGIMLQKIIPQMFFPTRHIPSQTFCDIKQIIIFLYTRFVVHFTLSVKTSSRHLSLKERLSRNFSFPIRHDFVAPPLPRGEAFKEFFFSYPSRLRRATSPTGRGFRGIFLFLSVTTSSRHLSPRGEAFE